MKIAIDFGGAGIDGMLRAQEFRPVERTVFDIGNGTIGFLGDPVERRGGNILAVAGLPIGMPDMAEIKSWKDAARLLPRCDGAFIAAFWDDADRKLVIVTDFLGMKPLYMQRKPGVLRLASETKAFAGAPDLAAWGAFIAFGHTIGARTLMSGVERVPPASVLVYDPAADRLEITCHWRWPTERRRVDRSEMLDALRRSVRAYANAGPPGPVLLSGGFDSRLILYLLKDQGIPTSALIVSHAGELFDADGRFARAVARSSGTPFRFARPAADFFATQGYLDYLRASDAATPSLYLFIAQVAQFIEEDAVWEGLVPGFALTPLRQPPGGFAEYLRQECRGLDSPAWKAAFELFPDAIVREMHESLQADLRREIAEYPDDGFGVNQFIVRNRIRNRVAINPFKVFDNHCRVYTPGLTRDFIEMAAGIPHADKSDPRFYPDLLRDLSPRSLDVPIISGSKLRRGRGQLAFGVNAMLKRGELLLAAHPRIARRLGFSRDRPTPSQLWRQLWAQQANPLLTVGLAAPPTLSPAAERLLFHCLAWQQVHAGGAWPAFDTETRTAATSRAAGG